MIPSRRRRLFCWIILLAFTLALLNLIVHHHISIHHKYSAVAPDDAPRHVSQPPPNVNHSTVGHKLSEADDEDNDDPFEVQNPQGSRWTSPFKHKSDAIFWWRNSDGCFEVDNICRSSQNKWFYYDDHHSSSSPIQPALELKYMPYSYNKGTWADVRVKFEVQSTSRVQWESLANNHDGDDCQISSAAYHVVLHSLFNVSILEKGVGDDHLLF